MMELLALAFVGGLVVLLWPRRRDDVDRLAADARRRRRKAHR